MTTTWKCLGALGCLLAWGCDGSECVLNDDLRQFAGNSARDCGTVTVADERTDTDACVVAAFEAGEPFIARYERMGIDSKVVTAVASNTDGKIKVFQWDSAPCGGPGCDPVTDVQNCNEPTLNPAASESRDELPILCGGDALPERICG